MKKVIKALAVIAGVAGALWILNTAGNSDTDSIGFGCIVLNLCRGLAMLVISRYAYCMFSEQEWEACDDREM